MSAATFKLNGKHVLAILIGFFLTVIIANSIFITFAVRSFPGEQEKKSYLQGLAYNDRIAEREAQEMLGWTATIIDATLSGGRTEIELEFLSASSAPISGLNISGVLVRPANDDSDHRFDFSELKSGRYLATIDGAAPGLWRFEATATSDRGETFRLEKRLILR
jgi:nitrogen fixation protein FixH